VVPELERPRPVAVATGLGLYGAVTERPKVDGWQPIERFTFHRGFESRPPLYIKLVSGLLHL
jgi:hypothetical protein